jgi:hypothetical protein
MYVTGISQTQCLSTIQGQLKALRDALHTIEELYAWSSGLSQADMEAATGNSPADALVTMSAIADAFAIRQIYNTGQAPANYPQVVNPYPFANSQREVIGPQ